MWNRIQRNRVPLGILTLALAAAAQTDRGTITGTVADPSGSVVPNAVITARNLDTSGEYATHTTVTGNYTLTGLPAGQYSLTTEMVGFSRFVQMGIRVQVAQIERVDISLKVGSQAESVSVNAEASLLKTESAEQSYNVTADRMNDLPLNYQARGLSTGYNTVSGSIRNIFTFSSLAPGSNISGINDIVVNGAPLNTFAVRIDGMDGNNPVNPGRADQTAPSVDSIEEISLQSSNFAAEYGQVAGGQFNFASKSGTNKFHFSAYEYLINEALNANQPFTNVRQPNKQNDFGFTVGGPVIIPKLYHGRDKTFFFLSAEGYRNKAVESGFSTVPTSAMRKGDFSSILTGRNLGTDPRGSAILENTIYDPRSATIVNGQIVTTPFNGNLIPQADIDPVSARIQALFPQPTSSGLVNNWLAQPAHRTNNTLPSLKLDHLIGSRQKLSFYYSLYTSDFDIGYEGLPTPLTADRDIHVRSHTLRLNYDYSLSPTVLLHLGAGYLHHRNNDVALHAVLNYPADTELGLVGGVVTDFGDRPAVGFPRMTGLTNSYGGMVNFGPGNANHYFGEKPTGVVNVSYVHQNHSYKFGVNWQIDGYIDDNVRGSQGIYNFSNAETGLPYTLGSTGAGSVGSPYASFLLGAADSASVSSPQQPQFRKESWSIFAQDTWKVTRKLTLDYGLRWDYQQPPRATNNRVAEFSPNTPNPSAGNLPGATIYEGYGPGRCNCQFVDSYPYAIGPRIGIAYQIAPKWVLRGGWGITYSTTDNYNYITNTPIIGMGWNNLVFTSPAYGTPALYLKNGLSYNPESLYANSTDAGIRPGPNQLNPPPYYMDPRGGRPTRLNQWNASLQHEIMRDLVAEAAYVGNRGVWEAANGLEDLNGLTEQRLALFGLNVRNAADRALLTSFISSPQVAAAGFKAPYAGFPANATLAQSLRPFPQFTNISVLYAPLGNSWYDALQAKMTKRFSHGLTATSAFTWQKQLVLGSVNQNGGATPINDVFNRSNLKQIASNSQPFVFLAAFNYRLPAWGSNRWLRAALRDWTVGGILKYASGLPIQVPLSTNGLGTQLPRSANGGTDTFANRVPGQPLFLQDLNCHCFDPKTTFVLNPKAWTDPGPGNWGNAAAFYNDYRYARRPDESMNFGRIFRIREAMSFAIRVEFYNVFNRTYLNNPTSNNAGATQSINAAGQTVSGFGYINTGTTFAPPRLGQLVARFQF